MSTDHGEAAGWRRTRRAATVVWLCVTGVQMVIWLLISVIGQRVAIPFWLWSGVGGGLIVGALWWVSRAKAAGTRVAGGER